MSSPVMYLNSMPQSMPALDSNSAFVDETQKSTRRFTIIVSVILAVALLGGLIAITVSAIVSARKAKKKKEEDEAAAKKAQQERDEIARAMEKAIDDALSKFTQRGFYKCKGEDGIYMILDRMKHPFVDWNAYVSHGSPMYMELDDCSALDIIPEGSAIMAKPADPTVLENGQNYTCDNKHIFLIADGKKRAYPSTEIWKQYASPMPIMVSCTVLNMVPLGEPMPPKMVPPMPPVMPPPTAMLPPGIIEGNTYKCTKTKRIYTIENGLKRFYPSVDIYMQHGLPQAADLADCSILDMVANGRNFGTLKMPLPTGTFEGQVIKCTANSKTYRIQDGKKRWYKNTVAYEYYGKPPATVISCETLNAIPNGADLVAMATPGK